MIAWLKNHWLLVLLILLFLYAVHTADKALAKIVAVALAVGAVLKVITSPFQVMVAVIAWVAAWAWDLFGKSSDKLNVSPNPGDLTNLPQFNGQNKP